MQKTENPGIYLLKDGRYRVRATVKCPKTTKMLERQKTLPLGTTQGQAVDAMADLREELLEGVEPQTQHQPKRITVADYAEQWLEGKAERLKPSVSSHYESILSLHILPHLGSYYLDALNRAGVDKWVAWAERTVTESGASYSQHTVRGWWRVLSCMLRDASAERRLEDPTLRVRPPKRSGGKHREKRTLSLEQLEAFLTALRKVAPQRYAEAFFLAYTGLRPGEAYVLRWADLDFESGAVPIEEAVWHQHVGTTKTDDPRVVPLTDLMIEVLQIHRREMLQVQHRGLSTGLVFPSNKANYRDGGTLLKPFQKAVAEADIQIHVTPQVLRRSFNTLMKKAQVDHVVLRSMMGHCSEEMTARYTGVDLDDKKAAVVRLFGRAKGEA